MIKGYVSSSDETDSDDYDFGYSEPLARKKETTPVLPEIQNEKLKRSLYSSMTEAKRIELFFKNVNSGNIEDLEDLVEAGVSVDCTQRGWTPLLIACSIGNVEVVSFLLDQGADPNKSRELLTPLMICCTPSMVEEDLKLNCVNLLLDHGAQVNLTDKYRQTALMIASESDFSLIVSRLLEVEGIKINATDKDGWTALNHAIHGKSESVVKLLIEAKCAINTLDKDRMTPLDLAGQLNLMNIAKLLGYKEDNYEKNLYCFDKPFCDIKFFMSYFKYAAETFIESFYPVKNLKEINLLDLLSASDEDLVRIGLNLRPIRKEILSHVHTYHLRPWIKSSQPEIDKNNFELNNAIIIVGNALKDLYIINATLKYVEDKVKLRLKENINVDVDTEEKIVHVLTNIYETADGISDALTRIKKSIEKIKPDEEGDYIGPQKPKAQSKINLFHVVSCTVLAVGCYVYYKCAL